MTDGNVRKIRRVRHGTIVPGQRRPDRDGTMTEETDAPQDPDSIVTGPEIRRAATARVSISSS